MLQRLRTGAVVVLLAAGFVEAAGVPRASAETRAAAIGAAVAYARSLGYHVGIAVLDTRTHRIYGGGADTGTFASESVVKAMIATRLLVQGRMVGDTARLAYKMIRQSDDAIASAFYPTVGGDRLINWVKRRYRVWDLGSPPSRPNWWGNTHITPVGLVKFYARMKRDERVAPWLLNAMHHARAYGSDGTYQFFGLPSATTGAAIKQGWGCDYDDWSRSADFNTTGFVDHDRYAVAILARGPIRDYGAAISTMLTRTARRLLPGGQFPDPPPAVRSLSRMAGRIAGGQRIGVYGSDFTHVRAVLFGAVPGTALDVRRPGFLRVTTPAHASGRYPVRVVTDHGTSRAGTLRFRFVAPPAVSSVAPPAGPTDGGTTVTVTGARLGAATRVLFGGTAGSGLHVVSGTSLTVVAPPHAAGAVDVRVVTPYGRSPAVSEDRFGYLAAPRVTAVSPAGGPAAGGTAVTITGTGLDTVRGVSFGGVAASDLSITSATTLTVLAPAHAAGEVDITVHSPGGTSVITPADVFTYTP